MKETKVFALYGHIVDTDSNKKIRIRENSFLICEEGKIAGIYPQLPEKYAGLPVERYEDCLIMPGMVDLHIHAPQYTFRGMGMDWELIDWLNQQTFPEESKYADLTYADKVYSIFAQNMQNSATTHVCMFATRHREATELLMDRMEQTGLVSYVGKVNMDREAPESLREASAEESAADTVRWLEEIAGRYEKTMPILTPRFIPSCTDALMEKLREIRNTYDLPVQSHLSENPGEIEWVRSLRPDADFYGDAYDRHDLFGQKPVSAQGGKTIMAHCIWSGEEEVRRIQENGVYIAHCPASNMNLSSGIAPIRKYLERGLRVGLGSDVAGGQTESMFRAMTDAIQVSKLYGRLVDKNSKPLTFDEAFYLATRGGGEFFGQVGGLEPGFEMSAIVLDDSRLAHLQPLTVRQRLERAVYLEADRDSICAKYVRGEKCKLTEA